MEEIIVIEPEFLSSLDEDFFFQWLKSIPAIEEIRGTSKGLLLKVLNPIDDDSLVELIGIMHRYSINSRALARFLTGENASWFHQETAFWFSSIFHNNP